MFLLIASAAYATMPQTEGGNNGGFGKPMALPNTQLWVHDVGKVWLSITNYGFFGSQSGDIPEYTGRYVIAPSAEYPGGSSLEYLFQGALWIGATYDTLDPGLNPIIDTLVSIGNDGWWGDLFEMFPVEAPAGGVEVRSLRPPTAYPYGDTVGAISEQDYIAIYSDTSVGTFVPPDPNDERPHIPLGIEITQKSYAWSYEYAEDFVLFDFDIVNIGNRYIRDVWVGMYIDADVWHSSEGSQAGAQDDICGFRQEFVSPAGDTTTINTAWIADADGNPDPGAGFTHASPRGLSGVRVVRTPSEELEYGFNWWISNTTAIYDWGPAHADHQYNPYPFPGGGKGTPGGDKAKYQVMSNGEFDYDQIYCNLDWTGEGWLARSSQASELAEGYDTRYLFSFGEFPLIEPNDTLKLTTAYICGEDLHVDPTNYISNLQGRTDNLGSVDTFYENLDFTDFATNSQWADWVYDNPGVDTDGDGYFGEFRINAAGDTFWYAGDGVPDFAGPPPPPSPFLTVSTEPGKVYLEWDGSYTESFIDNFLRLPDFEGYRVYMSRTGLLGDYTLLADYDIIDYNFTWLDETVTPPVWQIWKSPPHTLEQLVGVELDPVDTLNTAVFPDDLEWIQSYVDTSENWIPYGWNRGLGGIDGFVEGDSLYSYEVDGLSETVGLYFAVSAYDFGNPVTRLSPLASSPAINSVQVYPISWGGPSNVVRVYPNPYKITNVPEYLEQGYEDPDRSGDTQFDRRIRFSGFPEGNGVVRIFTIDGDLVVELPYTESMMGVLSWDVISRNTQAVVSGVYIFAIEMDNGYSQIGKFAIIK
jgi:hypothetical protein